MNRRVVQRAEAQAFADDNGLLYVEASAKSAEGVDGTHPNLYMQMVYDSCILSHIIYNRCFHPHGRKRLGEAEAGRLPAPELKSRRRCSFLA